jgi:hypothetical protein
MNPAPPVMSARMNIRSCGFRTGFQQRPCRRAATAQISPNCASRMVVRDIAGGAATRSRDALTAHNPKFCQDHTFPGASCGAAAIDQQDRVVCGLVLPLLDTLA